MILLIDNYDSFTYNLYQMIEGMGYKTKVVRNDKLKVADIFRWKPNAVFLSPGPGRPENAGILLDIVAGCKGKIPLFGICLGHQAIGMSFGAKLVKSRRMMHGKVSVIKNLGGGIFRQMPKSFEVTRYHSLTLAPKPWPKELKITAMTEDGVIMAQKHKKYLIESVQFHPESMATQYGDQLVKNFLQKI